MSSDTIENVLILQGGGSLGAYKYTSFPISELYVLLLFFDRKSNYPAYAY